MTYKEIQSFCASLDRELGAKENSRIVCISIATIDETGDVIFTCFNPHMRLCKCNDCKNTVSVVKEQVNRTGEYGELPV